MLTEFALVLQYSNTNTKNLLCVLVKITNSSCSNTTPQIPVDYFIDSLFIIYILFCC